MINSKKDLTIVTDGRVSKCDGCISRRGVFMANVDQPLYLTVSWQEKDFTKPIIYKNVKENYCYGCVMDLCDRWRNMIYDIYNKKHLERINS